ncbi:MAG: hypothetical protein V3V08_06270 [Nannocystaceae bacterium]
MTFAPLIKLWDAELLSDIGVFSNGVNFGARLIEVLALLEDDYENPAERSDRSQYRLAFEVVSDNDGNKDYACFSKAQGVLKLAVDYLIP